MQTFQRYFCYWPFLQTFRFLTLKYCDFLLFYPRKWYVFLVLTMKKCKSFCFGLLRWNGVNLWFCDLKGRKVSDFLFCRAKKIGQTIALEAYNCFHLFALNSTDFAMFFASIVLPSQIPHQIPDQLPTSKVLRYSQVQNRTMYRYR